MNLIPTSLVAKVSLTWLKTQKHSPKIMFAAGIVGVVATAVTASQATLKASDILEEHKQFRSDMESIPESPDYTHDDLVKDKALLAYKTSLKIAKLYAPAVIIGAASIGLLTGSHVMLTRRNASLTAAYASLDKAYRSYRERVRDVVGEEREYDLYRGAETEKVTVVDENGKKKQVTKSVLKNGLSPYAQFYTSYDQEGYKNPNWKDIPELNSLFLQSMEAQFNNQLRARGFLFLNEVLKELGMTRTKAGQSVGWVLESKTGDGYVDFGIFNKEKSRHYYDFAAGQIDGIWLDFNVDGDILDQLS